MLFLFLLINAVNAASLSKREFWTTMEILKLDWKDECLTTVTCPNSRFQISLEQYHLKERQVTSFPVYEDITGRIFSSHWTSGFPEDIQITTGVYGKDPEYGFQRHCASTPIKTIFPLRRHEIELISSQTLPQKELNEVTIKLQANCYNATIVIKKYTKKCPWCPDPIEEVKVEKQTSSFISESNYTFIIIALTGIAVVSCVLTLVIACIYCRKSSTYSSSINSSLLYSPHNSKPFVLPNHSRIPSPPSFSTPSPPSSTVSTSTVIIRDDTFYEEISDSSTKYKNIGEMV